MKLRTTSSAVSTILLHARYFCTLLPKMLHTPHNHTHTPPTFPQILHPPASPDPPAPTSRPRKPNPISSRKALPRLPAAVASPVLRPRRHTDQTARDIEALTPQNFEAFILSPKQRNVTSRRCADTFPTTTEPLLLKKQQKFRNAGPDSFSPTPHDDDVPPLGEDLGEFAEPECALQELDSASDNSHPLPPLWVSEKKQ